MGDAANQLLRKYAALTAEPSGCAHVVVRAKIDAADVLHHPTGRIARYKIPRHVAFVDALPRTGSGKVKKDELRRAFRTEEQC